MPTFRRTATNPSEFTVQLFVMLFLLVPLVKGGDESDKVVGSLSSSSSSVAEVGSSQSEAPLPPGHSLVTLLSNGNAAGAGNRPKINVLEVLTKMGKAIQLMISNGNGKEAISRSSLSSTSSSLTSSGQTEIQADGSVESSTQSSVLDSSVVVSNSGDSLPPVSPNEQGEKLRIEIRRRAGQLQAMISSALEVLRERGDVIVKRILEQLNTRLEQAKARADKVLADQSSSSSSGASSSSASSSASHDLALSTLKSINTGLNNLHALVHQVLQRVNISIKLDLDGNNAAAATAAAAAKSGDEAPAPSGLQESTK